MNKTDLELTKQKLTKIMNDNESRNCVRDPLITPEISKILNTTPNLFDRITPTKEKLNSRQEYLRQRNAGGLIYSKTLTQLDFKFKLFRPVLEERKSSQMKNRGIKPKRTEEENLSITPNEDMKVKMQKIITQYGKANTQKKGWRNKVTNKISLGYNSKQKIVHNNIRLNLRNILGNK